MKTKFKMAFGNTLITVGIVVLLFALFLNISTIRSIEKINRGGNVTSGYFAAIIGSGSMNPTISTNDFMLIKGSDSYQVGDIITYVAPLSPLTTHRIINVLPDGYITKGDANNIPDEKVTDQMVLGKMIYVIPGIGSILDSILSPEGVALLVCIFVVLCLIHRIGRSKDEKNQVNTKQAIEDS